MVFAAQVFVEKRSYDPFTGWTSWAAESFDQDPSVNGIVSAETDEEAFTQQPGGQLFVSGDLPFNLTSAGEDQEAEVRFTLQRPLPCQVVYRIDEITTDDPPVTTEGSEEVLNVLPGTPQTLNISGTSSVTRGLYLLGLRWQPWAA